MLQRCSLLTYFKRYYRFPLVAVIAIFMNDGFTSNLYSQSTKGITNQPDTSYTTYSAYNSTKKNYPDIKIVNEFKTNKISESIGITYCDVNGRQLKIDAFYPKEETTSSRTAIIIIHGGGWRSGNRTQHYPLAEKLALLGYACFTPEYRLSTEALFPAAIYDIKSAIGWVRKNATEYNIDTSKIVALGFSAGGEIAAFMGSTNGDRSWEGDNCNKKFLSNVNAVVDIDGLLAFIHPESGEGDDSKKTSAATYWFGYSKTENPELWKQGSPLTHVNALASPILFINSSVARMHAGRDDYIKILDQYHIYHEVKTFEGAPHSFCLFEPWFDPTVKYIDSFLKKVFNEHEKK